MCSVWDFFYLWSDLNEHIIQCYFSTLFSLLCLDLPQRHSFLTVLCRLGWSVQAVHWTRAVSVWRSTLLLQCEYSAKPTLLILILYQLKMLIWTCVSIWIFSRDISGQHAYFVCVCLSGCHLRRNFSGGCSVTGEDAQSLVEKASKAAHGNASTN